MNPYELKQFSNNEILSSLFLTCAREAYIKEELEKIQKVKVVYKKILKERGLL